MLEEFFTFPSNRSEALAMLYVQSNSRPDGSPEDLVDLYLEALARINKRFMENAEGKKKKK